MPPSSTPLSSPSYTTTRYSTYYGNIQPTPLHYSHSNQIIITRNLTPPPHLRKSNHHTPLDYRQHSIIQKHFLSTPTPSLHIHSPHHRHSSTPMGTRRHKSHRHSQRSRNGSTLLESHHQLFRFLNHHFQSRQSIHPCHPWKLTN